MKEIFGSQVEEFILGEDVKSIGEFAFAESPNLTTVHLSNGLTSIGSSAFINCSNLQNIYCYAEQVTETGDKVF